MITFVYCCVCLLIVCCQTTRSEDEDYVYTNDSPDFPPEVENIRYKLGSNFFIRCNSHRYYDQDQIFWEFKRCHSHYRGMKCDEKNMYKLDDSQNNEWKKLESGRRKRIEIRNATEEDEGVYRCIYNDSIIKIYIIDIIARFKYNGPPPKVLSLLPSSNTTILPTSNLVIQCKVASEIQPDICWFKECNGRRCEVFENGHCYCPIPLSNSVYSVSNDLYLSKLSIYNARTIDSGRYACFVISLYGQDYKNIVITVRDPHEDEESRKSFSLLFAIPLCFVLVPIIIWLCFNRRNRRNNCQNANEHHKQLIKPVAEVDIVVDVDDVV